MGKEMQSLLRCGIIALSVRAAPGRCYTLLAMRRRWIVALTLITIGAVALLALVLAIAWASQFD